MEGINPVTTENDNDGNAKPDDNALQLEIADRNEDLTIEKKLRVEDFRLLQERFNRSTPLDSDGTEKTSGVLDREEFIEAFQSILDIEKNRNQLEKLFDKLNSKESGLINWNDFCTYMLQFYQEEDYANTLRISPFNSEPKIRHVPHNKQEPTAKILHLDNPVKFLNISKEGYLGLWTPNLNLEKIYSAAEELDENLASNNSGVGQNRRRAGMWITDAIYMPDVHKLVLASTSRDLRFFTISSETFLEEFILFGLKNVPTCLDYYPSNLSENGESSLMFGDDSGVIHILYFKNPINSLFDPVRRKTDGSKTERTASSSGQRVFWDELKEHDKFVRHFTMGAVHREYVRKIFYVPHNNSIISSSGDSRNSLIIMNVNRLKKPYIFRLYKGCECFDFSKSLNLLITGGADYLARIWNPYVTQRNTAILEGHHAAVIDVKINDRLVQCYTFSKDAVVKAWDLKEFTCLQTISIRFPTTLGGKTPTFGLFPMDLYLNKPGANFESSFPGALVLGCNDYLCLMKLGQDTSQDGSLTETHKAPVSCAIYNPKLRQLITCADDSTMGAWDIESGRKAFFILDAHDGEEITCISIDRPCRKLATGARNGIVKIWNSANGQNLLVLPRAEDAEITGILFVDKGLITVGWSRKIVKYPDIVSDLVVPKVDLSWRGSQIHRDDILCLEHLMPVNNMMCTASYDGEIHVWSVDTEKLVMSLRKNPQSDALRPPSNYRRSSSHRSIKRGPTPVDKLVFLRSRAKENMKYGVLISSEGGYLHCWSLYGERKDMGMFFAASQKGESILALCTDSKNQYLISGDTRGQIRVWDIEDYCCCLLSPVRFDSTTPPLMHSWQAHLSPITFCEWTDYKGQGNFILTASTDHTARLWTISGEEIGIFGQRQLWDIDLLLSPERTDPNVQIQVANTDDKPTDRQDNESLISEMNYHMLLPKIVIDQIDDDRRPSASSFVQFSEVSQSTRTFLTGPEHSPLSRRLSANLGSTVERGLIQQKLQRQERRNRFGDIDGRQLAKGGVCFTPFALLSTQEIDDAIANLSQNHFKYKSSNLDDFPPVEFPDVSSVQKRTSKNRVVLPPIVSRQTSSSSLGSHSNSSVSFDNDIHPMTLTSKNSFLTSISEIS